MAFGETPEVLLAQEVRKRYTKDGPWAVDGISLDLRRGEVVSIVGPNGAGKSTLIQMMLGLLVPDSGTIRIFGTDMATGRRKVAHRINYASTDLSLPYSLTVRENLMAYALIYNMSNIRERIEKVLVALNLEPFRDIRVGRLSTGQVARMGIAKALINDPELLFLDEPTATLDPEVSAQLRATLQGMVRDRNMTLLYTSHNMREVERFSDRLYLMNRGRLVAEGTVPALMTRFDTEDLEALFLQMVQRERESDE